MLRFAEEVLLLALKEEAGDFLPHLPPRTLDIALAGSVLMDLALENRIDTDLDHLTVLDASPLADAILDPPLASLARAEAAQSPGFWVEQLARRADAIRETALAKLVEGGILIIKEGGPITLTRTVSRSRRYPTVDGKTRDEVRLRLMRVLFSQDIPDPRDTALICLADACGLFGHLLSRAEQEETRERLNTLRKMDLIGQAVAGAIEPLPPPVAARPARDIPQVPGLPLIGNTLGMARGLHDLLIDNYHTLGPIFRLRTFNRRFLVMVGPEANRFLARDKRHLRTLEHWLDFSRMLGLTKFLIGTEGHDHILMRRMHADYYSHTLLKDRTDEAVRLMRKEIDEWPLDTAIAGQYAFQRIVTTQIGALAAHASLGDRLDDLIFFFDTMLRAAVVRQFPLWVSSLPRFRRVRKRLEELAQQIMTAHAAENHANQPPDLIDDLLELHRTDPTFLPETDLWLAVLGPFAAGLDTVSTVLSTMSYELLKHPELLALVRAEADTLLAGGKISLEDVRRMDVTHRVALETMRRHPLVPGVLWTVANSFEFGGYQVPAGESVLVGLTATHKMPEYFPDPLRFDIERYTPERAEHRQAGVYVPFGAGPHQCLGRSLAEVLLVLNIAILFHTAELRLEPPDYTLKIKQLPHPHPAPSFRLRLVRRRS